MSMQSAKSKFLSPEQVLEFLRVYKQEFREHYGVESIGVFGSVLRGELREESDIDIAIEMGSNRKPLRNFLAIKQNLRTRSSAL